ncbi:MAG: hypothetical protein LAN18_01165 [Acidobacteriia bacterium]|nr:hypothetical protein [Terriglobia bacterium]
MNIRIPIALFLMLCLATALLAGRSQQKRPIREAEINAVIEAIQDEIYDLNLEKDFFSVGTTTKDNRDQEILNVYFQPDVLDNSRSWIIYKLMPDGEILRMYEIGRSGRIYLHGKPGEFRITQPDYPTVYMDDDDLCKLKHDWIKRQFIVDTNPDPRLVAAARERQRARRQASR